MAPTNQSTKLIPSIIWMLPVSVLSMSAVIMFFKYFDIRIPFESPDQPEYIWRVVSFYQTVSIGIVLVTVAYVPVITYFKIVSKESTSKSVDLIWYSFLNYLIVIGFAVLFGFLVINFGFDLYLDKLVNASESYYLAHGYLLW